MHSLCALIYSLVIPTHQWLTINPIFILQFPPCYKDISFWISDSFTENNLCEVVRGIAGDLVEEVLHYSNCIFDACGFVIPKKIGCRILIDRVTELSSDFIFQTIIVRNLVGKIRPGKHILNAEIWTLKYFKIFFFIF